MLLNMNECMNGTANTLGQWATEEGEQSRAAGSGGNGKGGREVKRGVGSQCNGACCMLQAARCAICHSVAVTVAAAAVVAVAAAATAWPTRRQSLIVVYYYHASCCCCCCFFGAAIARQQQHMTAGHFLCAATPSPPPPSLSLSLSGTL